MLKIIAKFGDEAGKFQVEVRALLMAVLELGDGMRFSSGYLNLDFPRVIT